MQMILFTKPKLEEKAHRFYDKDHISDMTFRSLMVFNQIRVAFEVPFV